MQEDGPESRILRTRGELKSETEARTPVEVERAHDGSPPADLAPFAGEYLVNIG